ncbi:glycogen debranching enzyme GlgX [Gilliamella sp. wkB108]|uniref:glycogen debranching protein GlgX n=1 Tax=Gilliamella sp. wkB108 TaxID=3120256 RepID=UPI00080E8F29|nr:glycogen debranching protein GlgX [Gilliamella apicola]OCG27324.1 glycogen debranching enzyme GlgX [Gilliamella apicola]
MNYLPMGSCYHAKNNSVSFTLFSASAFKVELCLLNNGSVTTIPINEKIGEVWFTCIENIKTGTLYCYRINDNQLLLLDPYAKAIEVIDGQFWSVVIDDNYDWGDDYPINIPWSKTIIYEAHVKGLTKLHPNIPEQLRGTYAGLSHPIMIDYLTELGITTIELLPVQFHLDEPRLQQLKLHNYWGYNVIAPFAVETKYWSKRPNTTPLSEFQDMVKALHKAGIEVILDVVFNHTAELDASGPTLSLKGIDPHNYYWHDEQDHLINWTGCGNSLKLTHPKVIQWVMDCLRYWVCTCHIDGFRFDLGTLLGRTPEFNSTSPLFIAIQQDPILQKIKLIAEPWDIGQGGYQLGNFPYPFAEWNDKYRDTMRRFWLYQDISLGEFAQRFAASSMLFEKQGRTPASSINYITCHDGFTMNDLVSFDQKHNLANCENNNDGNNQNWSNNFGVEGATDSPDILQKRLIIQKSLLATLLLSQGTPMLLAGDEWGNSQQGNNNGYCQDNELTWLNWTFIKDNNKDLFNYVKSVIQIRKQIVALNHHHWWQDNTQNQTSYDVRWLNQQGNLMSVSDWQQIAPKILQIELSNKWLIVINVSDEQQSFCAPGIIKKCILGQIEQQQIDTHNWNINAHAVSILILQE